MARQAAIRKSLKLEFDARTIWNGPLAARPTTTGRNRSRSSIRQAASRSDRSAVASK
jgi:hypothetical protein